MQSMASDSDNTLSHVLFAASLVAFIVCFFLPAYWTGTNPHYSFFALLLGPLGVLNGHFSWFANPLLLATWILRTGNSKAAFISGLTACAFALSFCFGKTIWVYSWSGDGPETYQLGGGYLSWLASMVLATLAGFVLLPVTAKNSAP